MKRIHLENFPTLAVTEGQKRLQEKHGTPKEFAEACLGCLEITTDEAIAGIRKYLDEWDNAK